MTGFRMIHYDQKKTDGAYLLELGRLLRWIRIVETHNQLTLEGLGVVLIQ